MLLRTSIFLLLLIICPVKSFGQLPTVGKPDQPANQNPNVPLTLDNALAKALSQVNSLQQAQISERIANEDKRQSRAALLPKFSLENSYIYTTPGPFQPGVANTELLESQPSFIAANAINEFIVFLNITGDLDIARKLSATFARDRAALAAARAQVEVAKKGLTITVTDAYYGLALARGNLQIAQETLAAAEDFLHITQLLYSGGEVAEADVLKARIEASNKRVELSKAEAAEISAEDALAILIGNDLTTPIAVEEIALATPVVMIDLNSYSEQLIANRPELAGYAAQLLAARKEIKIANSDLLPQFSYSINLGVDDSTFSFFRDRGAAFAITMKMPLFDWGATRSKKRQAQFRLRSVENERALAMKNFLQQFYTARANITSAIYRINETKTNIADATRSLALAIARYRAGEAPILEVTDAQNTLASVKGAYFQAIYDYRTSLARLEQAVGR
jgi:outer membrane protein TolC